MKGHTIDQYEANLPAGAVIDEVRYRAKSGQKVNYLIGTVKILVETTKKVVMVTWDDEGLCRRRSNNERLPSYDIQFAEDDDEDK